MMEWENVKIDQICKKITSGGTPLRKIQEYYGGTIPWVKTKQVNYNRIYSSDEYITELGLENSSAKLIPANSVIIAMYGDGNTAGRCAINKTEVTTNQACCNLIIDEKKADYNFVFYYLSTQYVKLVSLKSGAGQQNLNSQIIKEFEMPLPPLGIQRRIASILSAYDDLIENNLSRIKLLEELAQRTYEEWFVKFRVNGEQLVVNEKTGLPVGWEKKNFKETLNFKTGKLDSNAMIPNGQYDFYTCAKEIFKTNTFCFDGEAVLLGGNNATGNFSLFYANGKFDAYQRTYIVTSRNSHIPLVYVYYVLKKYLPHFQNASSGAATKFLTMKILDSTEIIIPEISIFEKYHKIGKPCFDKIINLTNQNRHLKESRDLLLPRLMSGALAVKSEK